MRRDVQASPDQLDFAEIMRSIFRRLPKLVLWSVAAGALAYGSLLLVAPRYQSEAEITITARSGSKLADPKRTGQSAEAVAVRMDKEAINTHVRSLLSRDLASEIASELKLADLVEFNERLGAPDTMSAILRLAGIGAPRAGETDEDRVLNAYFSRLEVYPAKESRVIGVRFTSADPQLAAQIANLLVEKYRALLESRSLAETDEALKVLEPRIRALTDEVNAAEQAVDKFRGEANIFRGGQQATGLNEQQLAELTAELSKAKVARSEADARTRSAREMMRAGSADALPDVQKSPLIQNLVQQRVRVERQISELGATLLPGHPRMQQLKAELLGIKRQINTEVGKVVDSLEKEAKVAALREESINKSLAEIKARIVTASPDEVKLRQLENDAKTKREELERLKAQFEANRVTGKGSAAPVEVEILTTASAASVPVFPKKGAFAALAATATFVLGLALLITRGVLAGARPPASQSVPAVKAAGARGRAEPELEFIPEAAEAAQAPAPRIAVQEAVPSAAPAAATKTGLPVVEDAVAPAPGPMTPADVAKRLAARSNGSVGLRTLVTGAREEIEASAETLALAKALSGSGRAVIVIDWSMTGDGLAAAIGVPTSPGMTELLDGKAGFQDIVHRVPGTEVHVIASGPAIENAARGLDADTINLVLDALDEAYDQIIVMAHHEEARALFETIEGRFDAGIIVTESPSRAGAAGMPTDTFLGFEVSDIDIIQIERMAAATSAEAPTQPAIPAHRLARVTGAARRAG